MTICLRSGARRILILGSCVLVSNTALSSQSPSSPVAWHGRDSDYQEFQKLLYTLAYPRGDTTRHIARIGALLDRVPAETAGEGLRLDIARILAEGCATHATAWTVTHLPRSTVTLRDDLESVAAPSNRGVHLAASRTAE